MMNLRPFVRMAKWAKNPPSERQVKIGLAIIAVCLVLFGIERIFGWPEWLTVNNTGRIR